MKAYKVTQTFVANGEKDIDGEKTVDISYCSARFIKGFDAGIRSWPDGTVETKIEPITGKFPGELLYGLPSLKPIPTNVDELLDYLDNCDPSRKNKRIKSFIQNYLNKLKKK